MAGVQMNGIGLSLRRGQGRTLSVGDKIQGFVHFMLAARWADNIRTKDPSLSHPLWHHISWPFKPDSEPEPIHTVPPNPQNIVTAMIENERIPKTEANPQNRAIALTWLFHLTGDIHQPLHTISLFTREYPNGDRGGNRMCIRVSPDRPRLALHRLWDGLLTSSHNVRILQNMAIELRTEFPRAALSELVSKAPQTWAKKSFEIAKRIAYQNGELRGTPKGQAKDCREVTDAAMLPVDYVKVAKTIAFRRMMLSGYRLANLIEQISGD